MDFADERYVRIYTRDTLTWKRAGWQGQAVLVLLLRKVDRAGIFDLGDMPPAEAVSLVTDIPLEVVEVGLNRLLALGSLEHKNDALIVPNFIEAQETAASDKLRAKMYRDRRRVTKRDENPETVTKRDASVTERHAVLRRTNTVGTVTEHSTKIEKTKGLVDGAALQKPERLDAGKNGVTPPPPIDPVFLQALERSVHLKPLADPKHGFFWQALFETFDRDWLGFDDEIRKADVWLVTNAARRPTERGLPNFFRNWMTRAVDRGRLHQPTATVSRFRR